MNNRDLQILKSRPEIPGARTTGKITSEELFQNKTLRPVIKLQSDLFLAAFINYIQKHKGVFYGYTVEQKLKYIENSLQKDIKFRNSLKGMVIGQFTTEEYSRYIENSSALNKRMMNLVIQKLQDNIQLLEYDLVS